MKVSLEVDLKNPQHLAAVLTIIRLFEFHDLCFNAPHEDTYRELQADVKTMTGSEYWNKHLAQATAEIAEALGFLLIDQMEVNEEMIADLLDSFYFYEGWKPTIESLRLLISSFDKFIAQSELIEQTRVAAIRKKHDWM